MQHKSRSTRRFEQTDDKILDLEDEIRRLNVALSQYEEQVRQIRIYLGMNNKGQIVNPPMTEPPKLI